MPDIETDDAPLVVNSTNQKDELRAVQHLRNAALLKDDMDMGKLNIAKRINHAAYGNYDDSYKDDAGRTISQIQHQFQQDGDAPALMQAYLTALANHAGERIKRLDIIPTHDQQHFNEQRQEAGDKRDKYIGERDYYKANPSVITDNINALPQSVSIKRFLPIGRLALEAGLVDGDPIKAADMIDDVLANATAHSLLLMAKGVTSTDASVLENYKQLPSDFRGQILAKADSVQSSTTALENVQLFTDGQKALLEVQALKTLLSAELNAKTAGANTDNPDLAALAETLKAIPEHVQKYQKVAMSLAYHFLNEGPAADAHDQRMKQVAEHLKATMLESGLGEPMPREKAREEAAKLAKESAEYLSQFTKDKPFLRIKLATLLKQVDNELELPTSSAASGIVERGPLSMAEAVAASKPVGTRGVAA